MKEKILYLSALKKKIDSLTDPVNFWDQLRDYISTFDGYTDHTIKAGQIYADNRWDLLDSYQPEKLLQRLKAGTIYGIFSSSNETTTYYYIQLSTYGNIAICHYGQYAIRATAKNIIDWLAWDCNREDHIILKPVIWRNDCKYHSI